MDYIYKVTGGYFDGKPMLQQMERQGRRRVMSKGKCFHVTTANGEVYGVAASTKHDAMQMTQDRLTSESSTDIPVSAQHVAMWQAPYGTVLHY
jgi:hypothetical protein